MTIDCNTQGCAMGLAALSGAFKPEGLSYGLWNDDPNRQEMVPTMQNTDGTMAWGFDATAKLFDITDREATYLFDPTYYSKRTGAEGELAVAKRIRDAVAANTIKQPSYG